MTYRKDIQILRGVAVLVVVLFHLDVPGFASGFLGVDVFFVVSGFLMAQLYTPGNVREFLLKRARRLLPAYVATILATLAAAALIVTPMDFKELVNQAAASALFVPNMHFSLGDSYFDKAEFKPLLHLWSLGVEIQFYLLVPLLAWLFVRARLLLPVLIVGSAVACFLVLSSQPKSAFFLLVFRLWEFLIGFAVARWA